MTQDTQPDDFDALFPDEATVTVAGEQFVLAAFKSGKARPYLDINRRQRAKAQALMDELADEYDAAVEAAKAAGKPEPEPIDVDKIPLDLLHERCMDEYIEIVALATGKPVSWVEDELDIDEVVQIAAVIHHLNNHRYVKKGSALTIVPGRRQGK